MTHYKLLACALWFALATPPALAERADRNKPVNLEADSVTVDDINKLSVYRGNVIMSQGTLMLRAERITVRQNDAGVERVSATGTPVAFRQRTDNGPELVEGFAENMEYFSNGTLDLIGRARLRRGVDELRGERISYNSADGTYKVLGSTNPATPGGRVRAVIRPKLAAPPAASAPAPAASTPARQP
jgi:lipopolysaccharide export system protein LptA